MNHYPPPQRPYTGPPYRHSGTGNKPIRRVVIHSTVSPCEPGGARAISAYFRSPRAGGSAQYVIDPAEAVQSAWDSVVCWHAPPNPGSLGNEMCDIPGPVPNDPPGSAAWKAAKRSWRWIKPNQRKMLRRTARLTAEQCLAYDLPVKFLTVDDLRAGRNGITTHANVSKAFRQSTHWDPGFWPKQWFMYLVRREVKRIKGANQLEGALVNAKISNPDVGEWAEWLARQTAVWGTDFVLLCETSPRHFRALSKHFPQTDWALLTSEKWEGAEETAILWRKSAGKVLRHRPVRLGRIGWKRRKRAGQHPPRTSILAVVRPLGKRRLLDLLSVHAPPYVNVTPDGLRGPDDAVAAFKAYSLRLRDFLVARYRLRPLRKVVVGGDHNEPATARGKFSPNWVAHQAGFDVHSSGGIDYVLTRNAPSGIKRQAPGPGMDHAVRTFTLEIS